MIKAGITGFYVFLELNIIRLRLLRHLLHHHHRYLEGPLSSRVVSGYRRCHAEEFALADRHGDPGLIPSPPLGY